MSEKNNKLEIWTEEQIKQFDSSARRTKASGASTQIGDIKSKYFFVECKEKHTKVNIIVDYKKEWLHLLSQLSINTHKIPIIITENKFGEKFITLDAEDFFKLVYETKGDNNE